MSFTSVSVTHVAQIARRDLADHRRGVRARSETADHEIAVGHDTDDAAVVDDRYRAAVVIAHRFRDTR